MFQPFAFNKTEIRTLAPVDPWPSALNAGLIGRWEVTNPASWPGSGTTFTNLATGSTSGQFAMAMTSSAIDTTNGVQWFGQASTALGTGMLFGVTGSFESGSYALNSRIIGVTNQVTALVLCFVSSSTPTNQEGLLINSWTDFNDQDFWLIGKDGARAVRTNSSYNVANDLTGYTVTNTNKLYGGRLNIGTGGNRIWRGTSNFATFNVSGTTFGTTVEKGKRSSWTLGSNFNAFPTAGSMNRSNFQGKWFAAYMWNRLLSDTEMQDVQTYTNTYVKANS
jgi:hypothetical protein